MWFRERKLINLARNSFDGIDRGSGGCVDLFLQESEIMSNEVGELSVSHCFCWRPRHDEDTVGSDVVRSGCQQWFWFARGRPIKVY